MLCGHSSEILKTDIVAFVKMSHVAEPSLQVTLPGGTLGFSRYRLCFDPRLYINVFGYNSWTVSKVISFRSYAHLAPWIHKEHRLAENKKLGEFLMSLKLAGNIDFRRFLNPFGDETFSDFCMHQDDYSERDGRTGLFCFVIEGVIKFVAKSHDNFRKRINQGYGAVKSKDTLLAGSAKKCLINSLITANRTSVELHVSVLPNRRDLPLLLYQMLSKFRPEWNSRISRLKR